MLGIQDSPRVKPCGGCSWRDGYRQQAVQKEREARNLRLVPVRSAIGAVTDIVEAFKEAKKALSDKKAEEAVVKSKIESVVRAITALEKAARDL